MKLRTILITAVLALMTVFMTANAQNKGKKDWQDRWKAEKIAFLTDAIDLTSAEAEKFWPVYNKCECEKNRCFKMSMEAYKALNEAIENGKSDSEVRALLDRYIEAQECGKNIDRKYVAEYRAILSDKKVAKLYVAEEAFRRQQIHRLHKNDNKEK